MQVWDRQPFSFFRLFEKSSLCSLSVVEPHTRAYSRIVYHFGPEILLENGKIDRQKLGQLIFASEEKRRLLNSITHPEIHKAMLKEILFYLLKGERLAALTKVS